MITKTAIKRRIDTNRVYQFEEKAQILAPFYRQLALSTLQKLASRIWREEGYPKPKPLIKFGLGSWSSSRYLSYYHSIEHEIILAEDQRDKITLIHELVHAKGRGYHSQAFFADEVYLLAKYCKIDFALLVNEAQQFGLRYVPRQ